MCTKCTSAVHGLQKLLSPVYVKSSGGIAVSRISSGQKILIYSVVDSLKGVGRNSGINFPTVFQYPNSRSLQEEHLMKM
jgi:hypothetical protein